MRQVRRDVVGRRGLRRIRRGEGDGPNHAAIQIPQHVAREAVEEMAFALASVAHLGILPRDPPVLGHAPPQR